jgi:hypothetical protein
MSVNAVTSYIHQSLMNYLIEALFILKSEKLALEQ